MTREAKFFKQARVRAKLTQLQVGKALGYGNAQFVSNIERGIALLPNDKVRDFCIFTGANLIGYSQLKAEESRRKIRQEIFSC